jgi:hypothetical protein
MSSINERIFRQYDITLLCEANFNNILNINKKHTKGVG